MILDLLRHFQPGKYPSNILEVTLSWATFDSPVGEMKVLRPESSLSPQDSPFQIRGVPKSQKRETGHFKCCFCPGTAYTFVCSSVPSAQNIHNGNNSSMTSIFQTPRPPKSLLGCRKISAFHSSHYTEAG